MSKNRKHLKQRHPKEPKSKKKIAQITKERLILVISILIAILAVLFFKAGNALWPTWMIEYRKLLIALILFPVIFLTLMSPVIIEANSDPRPLSGPGKNPEINLTDFFKRIDSSTIQYHAISPVIDHNNCAAQTRLLRLPSGTLCGRLFHWSGVVVG
jgi:hypothetical protein